MTASVCLVLSEAQTGCSALPPAMSKVCFVVVVEKCTYAIHRDETLMDVAHRHRTALESIWLLNPMITNPDFLEFGNITVNIGKMYKIGAGETLADVGARMGSTVDNILFLNADIRQSQSVAPGSSICVSGDLCAGRV